MERSIIILVVPCVRTVSSCETMGKFQRTVIDTAAYAFFGLCLGDFMIPTIDQSNLDLAFI